MIICHQNTIEVPRQYITTHSTLFWMVTCMVVHAYGPKQMHIRTHSIRIYCGRKQSDTHMATKSWVVTTNKMIYIHVWPRDCCRWLYEILSNVRFYLSQSSSFAKQNGSTGNRTRMTAIRGLKWCPSMPPDSAEHFCTNVDLQTSADKMCSLHIGLTRLHNVWKHNHHLFKL